MKNEASTAETAENAMREGQALFKSGDPERALQAFQLAADRYGASGDHRQQAKGLNLMAGVCMRTGRVEETLALFSRIIDVLAGDPGSASWRALTISNRGLLLARQDRFGEALGCFEEALAQFQQLEEPVRVAEQWANIGTTYRDLEQPDRAIDSYQRAYSIFRELGHDEGLGDQLTNIAYALVMRGETMDGVRKYREAVSYYTSAGATSKADSTKQNIEQLEAALMCSRDGTAKPCNC